MNLLKSENLEVRLSVKKMCDKYNVILSLNSYAKIEMATDSAI